MFYVLCFIIYGFFVGIIAKLLHPGVEPIGFLPTIGVGVAGSYIGGFLSWFLGLGSSIISPSGIFMGIIGGIVFCYIYSFLKSRNNG